MLADTIGVIFALPRELRKDWTSTEFLEVERLVNVKKVRLKGERAIKNNAG
jgi:hypothetical protein